MNREKGSPYWENDAPVKSGIFLSYRFVDIWAGVLMHELLRLHYSDETIFRDYHSLQEGEPFERSLHTAIAQAGVMLVVIGSEWASSLQAGRHTWALYEIQKASEFDVPLLPVLLTRAYNGSESVPDDDTLHWRLEEESLETLNPDTLPSCIPPSILHHEPVTLGTVRPSVDVENIVTAIGAIVPALHVPNQS